MNNEFIFVAMFALIALVIRFFKKDRKRGEVLVTISAEKYRELKEYHDLISELSNSTPEELRERMAELLLAYHKHNKTNKHT